jgi:hypothetical protein
MKVKRKSQDDGKSNDLTHEEAQRRLDAVRRRYGIHLADPQARPITDTPSKIPKGPGKRKLGRAPSIPETRVRPVDRTQAGTALGRGEPGLASKVPSDSQTFHYLVRIAECTSVLHCEIKADHPATASDKVKRIPNLMEWREVSIEELAEIVKNAK